MYYGRKKGLIVLVILIILILLLVAGGVTFAFLATDIFKSNDTMFFKYIGKSIEEIQFTENIQLSTISKLEQQMPYTIEGSIGMNVDGTGINQSFNNLSKAKIEYTAKVDPIEEKAYAKADLKSNNNTIFTLEYANSNDIYALKSDEIVNAFVGIENKNLNTFAQKFGVGGTATPEQIQPQNLANIFTLSEQEKQYIIDTYMQVIKENIPSSCFTKENDIATKRDGITYNTTGYRLNLTYGQLKSLEISLLNTLKQDNITLNIIATKAEALGLGSDYTEISSLATKIDEYINKIQGNVYNGNDISIIVYVSNGEVITTEIIEKNNAKYTIYCKRTDTGVTRNILIENFDVDAEYGTININMVENNTSTQSYMNLSINIDDTKNISLNIKNEGSAAQEYLNSTVEVSVLDENGNEYNIQATQKLQFVEEVTDIIELSRNNCGVLNDYTADQTTELVNSIVERIKNVFEEKMQILGVNFNENNIVNPVLNDVLKEQEIQTYNASFESYKGKISGTSLNALNNAIKKHNESSTNKNIVLIVDGINVAGDSKTIENTKTYNVEMVYNDEGYIYQINATSES